VRKFCFTLVKRLTSLGWILNRTHTVSPTVSRKSFLAKLGGLLALGGLVPALFGKAVVAPVAAPVSLRVEPRAVPRKEGSC
jgi:hypothetical protein